MKRDSGTLLSIGPMQSLLSKLYEDDNGGVVVTSTNTVHLETKAF